MKGNILMSAKEADRINIMNKLVSGEITAKYAAQVIYLSIRQVRRLKLRYVKDGAKGLIHKSRGRQGNRSIPKEIMEKALTVIKDKYCDFGPTLALEKLKEQGEVPFERETLRKTMIAEGLWKSKRRKYVVIHQSRKRRDREGELIQADGSPHAWFEKRGTYCNLLVFIDDATGKLKHLQFVKEEKTNDYFRAMYSYIRAYGKPLALYVDKHSIFKTTRFGSGLSGIDDSLKDTQFTKAMRELGIELICANSPQAKGRVEKVNRTLQDRLVKEMRLKGINNMEEGNKYLSSFIKMFNEKFAVDPASKENAHRPLLVSENLKEILVKKEVRILSKNLEFQYGNKLYQVKTERALYALRHAPIVVNEDWDGLVKVYYKGKELKVEVVERLPLAKVAGSKEIYQEVEKIVRKPYTPVKDHPWRRFVY